MRTTREEKADVHTAPGAFTGDGSWYEDGELSHQGAIHRFVAALVRQRRDGRLTAEQAARAIEAASATQAFPCWRQWLEGPLWALAWTSSSAEEAVKREGRGVDGHWCGERWAAGAEVACQDARHHSVPRLDEAKKLVAAILQNVASAPSFPVCGKTPPPPTPTACPKPDEAWQGWGRFK
jgi:hypothetical protein